VNTPYLAEILEYRLTRIEFYADEMEAGIARIGVNETVRRDFRAVAVAGARRYVEKLRALLAELGTEQDWQGEIERAAVVQDAAAMSGWLSAAIADNDYPKPMRQLVADGVFAYHTPHPLGWPAIYRLAAPAE
jgi:hypothetical protein